MLLVKAVTLSQICVILEICVTTTAQRLLFTKKIHITHYHSTCSNSNGCHKMVEGINCISNRCTSRRTKVGSTSNFSSWSADIDSYEIATLPCSGSDQIVNITHLTYSSPKNFSYYCPDKEDCSSVTNNQCSPFACSDISLSHDEVCEYSSTPDEWYLLYRHCLANYKGGCDLFVPRMILQHYTMCVKGGPQLCDVEHSYCYAKWARFTYSCLSLSDFTILPAPVVQQFREFTQVATVFCFLFMAPEPLFTWTFEGTRITSGGRYSVNGYYLEISNITVNDIGWYTCEAQGDNFKDLGVLNITVSISNPGDETDLEILGDEVVLKGANVINPRTTTTTQSPVIAGNSSDFEAQNSDKVSGDINVPLIIGTSVFVVGTVYAVIALSLSHWQKKKLKSAENARTVWDQIAEDHSEATVNTRKTSKGANPAARSSLSH